MRELMNEARFELGKADALLFAYEKTYLDIDRGLDDWETVERRDFAFHAIWDSVKQAICLMDRLEKAVADTAMCEKCSLTSEE